MDNDEAVFPSSMAIDEKLTKNVPLPWDTLGHTSVSYVGPADCGLVEPLNGKDLCFRNDLRRHYS